MGLAPFTEADFVLSKEKRADITAGLTERLKRDAATECAAAKADDFGLKTRVGRCEDDLCPCLQARQCKRDRKAVCDLMNLIMVEEEADAHLYATSRPRPTAVARGKNSYPVRK